MPDYLTQLVLRVQQPELGVQPRLPSSFESPGYLPELSEAKTPGEEQLQASPIFRHSTTLEEWTSQARGKNRNEAETAELMSMAGPDAGRLGEGIHRPYQKESVNSLVDKIESDQQSPGMGEDLGAGEPSSESYEDVVREERKSAKAPAHQERSSREQPFSSSPEPRESSVHAEHIVEMVHRPKYPHRELQSSAPKKITVKQEPDIRRAGRQQQPHMAIRSRLRTRPGREEKVFDATFPSEMDILPIPNRERLNPLGEPTVELSDVGRGTPPPTIHVSIGRIDVRATTASAPSKKVQAKSSAMSLDEYLARRNEGRR